MKALFIVHGFPPAEHSGTFRSAAFARYLPDFGITPLVICASDEADAPAYREPTEHDASASDHIALRLDWKWRASSRGAWQHLLRRVPLGWTIAQRRQYRAVANAVLPAIRAALATHRPDVLYASSPPPVALVLAAQASKESRLPYVCDLRDPWSYYSWARYRHVMDFLMERALERRVLGRAAAVIANTPTARQLLVSELQVPPSQVPVLMNGYDEADFSGLPRRPVEPRDFFEIVYTGLLSSATSAAPSFKTVVKRALGLDYSPLEQDPGTRSPIFFLQGVAAVLQRRPEYRSRLRIRFVGAFTPDIRAQFAAFPFPDVLQVQSPVSKAEAIRLAAQADLCLLLQIEMKLRGRDFCTSIPGKLFDYLRAGVPILAPMQRSDATDLIEKLEAGFVVPPRDTPAIAATIESELNAWEARKRIPRRLKIRGLEEFDRRNLTGQLADILRRAVSST